MIDTGPNSPAPSRSLFYRWFCLIIVAAALAVFWYYGHRRVATGYSMGRALNGQAQLSPLDKSSLRFATFNIHGGRNANGVRNLVSTVLTLQGFDIIGLQEVHGPRLINLRDQAQIIGQSLEMAWLFAPTERHWWRDDFGNGLLSKLPVNQWERFVLAGPPRGGGRRNVVFATLSTRGQKLHILITHLDKNQYQKTQLRAVIKMFLALDPPAVLMGDLNARQTDSQIRSLLARPGVVDPIGEVLGDQDLSRVDWILARGLLTVAAGTIDLGASDHPCLWAELKIPGAAGS
jgi:endonuclease/exonuclease/phosphatase family metal-dependent hydrolase